MYESFYHLTADPFRLSPDPGFSYPHRSYRKAMTYMLHALQRAEGFIMITGQPGTGKTTLIGDLVQKLRNQQVDIARIVSTQLTANDLLDLVAYSFKLNPEGCSKAKILIEIERLLKKQHQARRRPLLIVDEAQDMGEEALEELRLLTNIQTETQQLLQVFLVGQEQLRKTVNSPSLEQLHQRLIAATHLEPLDTADTIAYVKHRLRRAGWKGDPLVSNQAFDMIRHFSHGIPRQINQICNRLFLHGCIEEKHRLGLDDLRVVIDELRQESLLPKGRDGKPAAPDWPEEPYDDDYDEEVVEDPPSASCDSEHMESAPPVLTQAVKAVDSAAAHLPPVAATEGASPRPGQIPVQHTSSPIDTAPARRGWQPLLALLLVAVSLLAYWLSSGRDLHNLTSQRFVGQANSTDQTQPPVKNSFAAPESAQDTAYQADILTGNVVRDSNASEPVRHQANQ